MLGVVTLGLLLALFLLVQSHQRLIETRITELDRREVSVRALEEQRSSLSEAISALTVKISSAQDARNTAVAAATDAESVKTGRDAAARSADCRTRPSPNGLGRPASARDWSTLLRRVRREPTTRERFRLVGTDGAVPDGLDETFENALDQALAAFGQRLLAATSRRPLPDNECALALTWCLKRCPEDVQERLVSALEARLAGHSDPDPPAVPLHWRGDARGRPCGERARADRARAEGSRPTAAEQ